MPHPTTLMKITTRCGEAAVDGLNEALLAKAVEAKVLKTNRVRADTTVVEANVAYPSDSSLLAKGVARIATTAKRLQGDGVRDTHQAGRQDAHGASRARRSTPTCGAATTTSSPKCAGSTPSLAAIAERVAGQADAVVRDARRSLRRLGDQASGRARAAVGDVGAHRRR